VTLVLDREPILLESGSRSN